MIGWWCRLCAREVTVEWFDRPIRLPYHRFGTPPHEARHAVHPIGGDSPDVDRVEAETVVRRRGQLVTVEPDT